MVASYPHRCVWCSTHQDHTVTLESSGSGALSLLCRTQVWNNPDQCRRCLSGSQFLCGGVVRPPVPARPWDCEKIVVRVVRVEIQATKVSSCQAKHCHQRGREWPPQSPSGILEGGALSPHHSVGPGLLLPQDEACYSLACVITHPCFKPA